VNVEWGRERKEMTAVWFGNYGKLEYAFVVPRIFCHINVIRYYFGAEHSYETERTLLHWYILSSSFVALQLYSCSSS
jgi:hypothetical protein